MAFLPLATIRLKYVIIIVLWSVLFAFSLPFVFVVVVVFSLSLSLFLSLPPRSSIFCSGSVAYPSNDAVGVRIHPGSRTYLRVHGCALGLWLRPT